MSSTANPPLVACPLNTIRKSVLASTVTWAGIHVGLVVSMFLASRLHTWNMFMIENSLNMRPKLSLESLPAQHNTKICTGIHTDLGWHGH